MAPLLDDLRQAGSRAMQWGRRSMDALAVTLDQQGELARLSARLRRINRERDQVITEIGKKTYALYTRGKVSNQDILADCHRVDELSAEATRIREEMDRLRHGGGKEAVEAELKDEGPLTVESEMAASAQASQDQTEPTASDGADATAVPQRDPAADETPMPPPPSDPPSARPDVREP